MITSLQMLPVRKYLSAKRFLSILLFIIFILILNPFHSAYAQELDDNKRWSIGFQAGVLSGNLPTVSATNTLVSRFNVENDYYFTAAFQSGYAISEYESLHLTLSRSEFSVFTDYEFWPDVLFKNQFYTANLSAQLDLRRFIGTLPNRLDPYGSFGLGLMSSRNTVAPLNSQGTSQNDYSDNQSNNLSFLFTTGFGLDYSLNSRISVFFQFNHNFLSTDIIDKNLAGEILQNDFIQTTKNWSTYTSGFRLKFGRAKARTQPEPARDDFQIISTINADRLSELDDQVTEPNESMDEEITESDSTDIQPASPPVIPDSTHDIQPSEEISDLSDFTENITESDSNSNQAPLIPGIPDITAETQPSEEISDNENLITHEVPVTELNGITDDYEDDFIFVTQPRYGLMGIAIEEISGSFSLNLHSFTDPEAVTDIVAQLNENGFRVVTQTANVNGIDYFRVAVGQFESRREARSAAQNLPESYRNNYFIIQI